MSLKSLVCFSQLRMNTRHFATLASLRHITSPKRQFATKPAPFQPPEMRQIEKKCLEKFGFFLEIYFKYSISLLKSARFVRTRADSIQAAFRSLLLKFFFPTLQNLDNQGLKFFGKVTLFCRSDANVRLTIRVEVTLVWRSDAFALKFMLNTQQNFVK